MTYKIQHIPLETHFQSIIRILFLVSLPSLQNVIDYEENKPEFSNQLNKNGYPKILKINGSEIRRI